ncbi:programmed cell death protein [Terramyces sp. JEL0728]|nr:programmed cell death protein [Terramyces sp. JEL0728]
MQVGFAGSETNEDTDKIGGSPYGIQNPPCPHCAKLCYLLTQIYSMDRTVLVFICTNNSCKLLKITVVEEIQVSKTGPLFKVDSWSDSEDELDTIQHTSQVTTKKTSTKIIDLELYEAQSKFPCFELYFENEEIYKETFNREEQLFKEYLKNNPQDAQILNGGVEKGDWKESYEPADISMKLFKKFTKILQSNPTQVMRYEYNGTPVYYKQMQSIPNCQCGSKRVFEFQIMPYVLTMIQTIGAIKDFIENGLDFGTILVFVCEKNCDAREEYSIMQYE